MSLAGGGGERVGEGARLVRRVCVLNWGAGRYKKGSHPKGRAVFQKDIEPFMKWLEEAEEDEEDEE